ncbi:MULTISPECIES: flagellar hook-length control protein FliK [unclassified Desulfovibrio]|uniref:flagellar hook-length control protein FliK n=1 Tax=unclassified Desulfovibrio TaxID=2593640 RepID=UPI002FDB244C
MMQIIPTSAASFDALFTSSKDEGSSFADFFSAVHDAIDSVERGEHVSASAAASEAPRVQSPYSRTTTNGVTYTLDEVCFTKQELAELRRDLLKAGAPLDALKKFDALADQPDGATLAQVMASLQNMGGSVALSDEDKTHISTLLKKIDPSGVLETRVQQLIGEGKGEAALDSIYSFMAHLDPTAGLDVETAEALALGRGIGLDTTSLQTLLKSFGGNDGMNLLMGQFSSLMAPAAHHFTEQKTAQKQLDAALQQTLQPLVSKARARTEKELQASALRNKEAQQSKILIDQTVQKNTRHMLEETLTANSQDGQKFQDLKSAEHQSNAVSRKLDGSQSAGVGHAGAQGSKAETAFTRVSANTEQASNQQSTTQQHGEGPEHAGKQNDAGKNGQAGYQAFGEDRQSSAKDSSRDASWGEMTRKVDVQPLFNGRQDNQAAAAALQTLDAANQASAEVSRPAPIPRYVAQQVEQGLLSSFRSGTTRLDLQLHPQELGAITLSLSLRNGEVSATIRSEKTETAEMVTRQLEAIRTNLEQQGLKVDKVEVQLNSRQQDENAWQNLNQHNSWQEEDARREELSRLKNLSTMRNTRNNLDETTLEQPVHSHTHAARYTTRSLHVVA